MPYNMDVIYILVINLFLAVRRRCRKCWSRHIGQSSSLARHLGKSIRVERSIDEMAVTLNIRQRLPDYVGLVEKALVSRE